MTCWKSHIDSDNPCWNGYREVLECFSNDVFPGVDALNASLPAGVSNCNGLPIRFVPAAGLPGVGYEKHIFETGDVSTRADNWHDLFNALVWIRLPRLKAAMNALHYENLEHDEVGRRGKLRDGLTLFDESGVIVSGSNQAVLNALAKRDWETAFITHHSAWDTDMKVVVCGHAILEKFVAPYKSVTAHALLVNNPGPLSIKQLDELLGRALRKQQLFKSTAGLSPLPLMGIPGWWAAGAQDRAFYQDRDVFRPAAKHHLQAPVCQVDDL